MCPSPKGSSIEGLFSIWWSYFWEVVGRLGGRTRIETRSLGVGHWGCPLSWAPLCLCFLSEVNSLCHMLCLTTDPESKEPRAMDWSLWYHEPKKSFPDVVYAKYFITVIKILTRNIAATLVISYWGVQMWIFILKKHICIILKRDNLCCLLWKLCIHSVCN
jgi:hypothetical protein